MPEWESWSHSNLINEDVGAFPCLKTFGIRKCPKLIGELPKCLRSLVKLDVSHCPELVCPLSELASLPLRELKLVALQELEIRDCGGLTCLWEEHGVPCNLKILRIQDTANQEKLPNGLQTLTCLEELEIWGCPKLESFPETGMTPTLRHLVVIYCESLKWLPHNHNSCALESLVIWKCPFLVCFPSGELPTTLTVLDIKDCENLESLPEGMMPHNSTSCLQALSISNCSSLKSFSTGQLPSTLRSLQIDHCPNLESTSENMCPNNTALEFLHLWQYPNLRILPECLHSLKELHIVNCESVECFLARGLSIPTLTRLRISECQNLKSLPHQMRNLNSLQMLSIWHCRRLESFPEGVLAPNLTSLKVGDCRNLKTPISEWGLDTLTSLSELTTKDMFPDMVSFSDEECLLPISLNSLTIDGMKSLASLALQNLISLQVLEISNCHNLRSWVLRPATLESLTIQDCPILKEGCLKDKGKYWPNIAHIPWIEIDRESMH